jgi:hypothetical protein
MPGEYVYRIGEKGDRLYFVKKGEAQTSGTPDPRITHLLVLDVKPRGHVLNATHYDTSHCHPPPSSSTTPLTPLTTDDGCHHHTPPTPHHTAALSLPSVLPLVYHPHHPSPPPLAVPRAGQLEIVLADGENVASKLRTGDMFGQVALSADAPHEFSVRAR